MNGRNRYDAIVIGAGHNGMVCAFYLARARRRVLVVDAADSVGGAARPVAFGDLRVPYAAHLDYGFSPQVAIDMELERHGLAWASRDIGAAAFGADGARIDYSLAGESTPAPLRAADADRWPTFRERMQRFATVVDDLAGRVPPRLSGADARAWLTIAWRLRRLGAGDMREFLRIGAINVFDVLEETFDDPLLKGALAAEALLGHGLAPRSANSVLTFLMRLAGNGGAVAMPRGGMTALGETLRSACVSRGVGFRLDTPVCRIVVEGDRATGVELEGGEIVEAENVVSSADARTTGLELIGAGHLDTGLVRRLEHVRREGCTARIDFLLDSVDGLDRSSTGRRLLNARDMDSIELAFNEAKYGEVSSEPILELVFPTVVDPAQKTGRHHLATALVQYVPRTAPNAAAQSLDGARTAIERMVPGFADRVIDTRVVTPGDVESATGIAGGHWHHAEVALDQYFMLRPVPSLSRHALPVAGAWLCGATMHPGGGICGLPGRHAAAQIIASGNRS